MPRRKRGGRRELEAAEADIEAMVAGMIETDAMEACARYLTRGRQLAGLGDGELQARWAQAFRAIVADRTRDKMRELEDTESELRLRKIEPDESQVEDAISAISAEIRQLHERHPNGIPAVREAVRKYLQRRDTETN